MYSIKEASEKLNIKQSTLKWYIERFNSCISPSKGRGSKRLTADDLSTLKRIHELSQKYSTDEIDSILEGSNESNITMYNTDTLNTTLDIFTDRIRSMLEETINKTANEVASKASDEAINKLIDSIGGNTKLNVWIDNLFKKTNVSNLKEAKSVANQIKKAIIERWKHTHK
jgi:DNA-binding transcriptional MerR regulator